MIFAIADATGQRTTGGIMRQNCVAMLIWKNTGVEVNMIMCIILTHAAICYFSITNGDMYSFWWSLALCPVGIIGLGALSEKEQSK